MISLILATRNHHKVQEIQGILGRAVQCGSLADFPLAPVLIEEADTFAGNATHKALQLTAWLATQSAMVATQATECAFVLADDSGLEVDALHGAPGVWSARYAAGEPGFASNAPDSANNAKLLRLLTGLPLGKRTARFRCVLALVELRRDSERSCLAPGAQTTRLFEGVCEGHIGFEPRGQSGFGFDPLFIPLGYDQSFAELGENVKNQMSHRARALIQLKAWLDRNVTHRHTAGSAGGIRKVP